MKRFLTCALVALSTPYASSACGLGLDLGAGLWRGEVKGETGEPHSAITLDDLGFDKNGYNLFWAVVEHPVPVLPNFKILHTDISTAADAVISQSFALGDTVFNADVRTLSELVLSHTDATFYYEILDNWLEADLGVTARLFGGYVEAQSEVTPVTTSPLKGSLPMLYASAQFNLPETGFYVAGTANVIRYRGDGFHDYEAKMGYLFETPGLAFGLNLGYREMSLDVAEFDDLYVDASVSGLYLAVFVRF